MQGSPPPAREALARILAEFAAAGVAAVPRAAVAPSRYAPDATAHQDAQGAGGRRSGAELDEIATRVRACTRCTLCESRQQAVPGEGAPGARVLFVGEAPGAEEDRQGRPFVGPAGQLLDKIISQGMGLRREEVFIANVLKCRPPRNRDPQPEEVAACTPHLLEQVRAIAPSLVVALGRHAAHHLLETDQSLGRLRGVLHPYPPAGPEARVLVTYHPAYLLRNPAAKRDCWQDVQLGMRHLGLPLPGERPVKPG